ncbi:hypothetical protein I8751_16795 [Nostocaceae cyanobacterium CENA357]|uniref:Uncharacterized protein n=1 Tax=Atlanticothrix silvestris CENA357 TaxID=1725252 RepID=A0A8J7L4V3_9CYAN|nr:hypothetical protein [Atlanticothrix silvestris]MBH8553997.1 hypothetical protein [Atlanticothrix silvestris CENA357]
MKKFLYGTFSGVTAVTALVMTILSVTAPISAIENPPALNDSLNSIYPREPNFFTRGREQFEKEIQLLLNKRHSSPDTPLKISPEQQQIQEQLTPLEKPQVLPSDTDKSDS